MLCTLLIAGKPKLNRSQEILNYITETQIDRLFDQGEFIIRKNYTSWDEVESDLIDMINKYYKVSEITFRNYSKGSEYFPISNRLEIGIYSNPTIVNKSEIINILSDVYHELSHVSLASKSLKLDDLNSKYANDVGKFDTYVLTAIERPAWALSMAFKLIDLKLRPITIIKLSDDLRGTFSDPQDFMRIAKQKGCTDDMLLYFLYALSNNPKNDPRSLKILDLLNKYFNKIWMDYLGTSKYARRGIPGFVNSKVPFL